MKIGSLFSGIGGIELGFEKAGGFETIWFVEKELYPQAVLKKTWPKIPIYGDIKKVNFKKLPRADILTGGFPCQDISNAGKRKGIKGERSGLWKEFFRAISEIRPKYVFVENVSALTQRGLFTVLGDLASLNYDAEGHCIPASALGAPHRRDRIYILAYSNNNGCVTNEKREKIESSIYEKQARKNNTLNFKRYGYLSRITKKNVANSNEQSMERRQPKHKTEWILGKNSYEIRTKQRLREKNRQETWATDTGILRVAHGIPNRIHRIKCLGNAVVPQCAEFFAEIIKEKEDF